MNACEKLDPSLPENLTGTELTLFDGYLHSQSAIDHAIEIQDQSRYFLPDVSVLYSQIKGLVFESIATSCLKSQINPLRQRLLTKEEVLDVYSKLFPHKKRLINEGLTEGIPGLTIPNAILMERRRKFWQIQSIFEMQSGNGAYQEPEQIRFYENAAQGISTDFKLNRSNGKQDFGYFLSNLFDDIDPLPVELDQNNFKIIEVIPEDSLSTFPYSQLRIPVKKASLDLFIKTMLERCSEEDLSAKGILSPDVFIMLRNVIADLPPVLEEIFGPGINLSIRTGGRSRRKRRFL